MARAVLLRDRRSHTRPHSRQGFEPPLLYPPRLSTIFGNNGVHRAVHSRASGDAPTRALWAGRILSPISCLRENRGPWARRLSSSILVARPHEPGEGMPSPGSFCSRATHWTAGASSAILSACVHVVGVAQYTLPLRLLCPIVRNGADCEGLSVERWTAPAVPKVAGSILRRSAHARIFFVAGVAPMVEHCLLPTPCLRFQTGGRWSKVIGCGFESRRSPLSRKYSYANRLTSGYRCVTLANPVGVAQSGRALKGLRPISLCEHLPRKRGPIAEGYRGFKGRGFESRRLPGFLLRGSDAYVPGTIETRNASVSTGNPWWM